MAEDNNFVFIFFGNGKSGAARPIGKDQVIMVGVLGHDFPVVGTRTGYKANDRHGFP